MTIVETLSKAAHLSGGRAPDHAKGWARCPYTGTAGHFWTHTPEQVPRIGRHGLLKRYTSACGLSTHVTDKAPMFGIGTWPACRHCLRKRPHPTARERLTLLQDGTLASRRQP